MENNKFTSEEYQQAKQAVENRIGFYIHLIVYVVVNVYLVIKNLDEVGYFWAIWPILLWGIGLSFHAVRVFGFFNNQAWVKKQILKELERRKKLEI